MELATKRLLALLLIVSTLIACKVENESDVHSSLQKVEENKLMVPKDSTKLIQNIGLVYYQEKPLTGTTTVHNENKILVESITYVEGKKNGFYKKWFSDGNISFQSFYENGKQSGKTRSWWKNGNLRSESNFNNGTLEGIQKTWYQSGAKFKEISLVDGKEHGMQKSWRENGKIYNNYEAKDGRIFGLKKASLCFQLDDEQFKPSTK